MKSLTISQVALAAAMVAGLTGAAFAQDSAEEANKALVLRLYDEAFNGGQAEIANQLISADAAHHGADVAAGPAGELALFDALKSRIPGVKATIAHTAADGDIVAVHWHASATPEDGFSGEEWADYYRVANGSITEHWTVHETIPATSVSGLDPFVDAYKYPDGAPTLTEEQEDANKDLVETATGDFRNLNAGTVDKYWAPEYWQHSPTTANGSQAFKDMIARFAGGPPGGAPGGAPAGGPPGGAPAGGPPAGGAPAGGPPGGAPAGGAPGGPPAAGAGGFPGAAPAAFEAPPRIVDGDLVWVANVRGTRFQVDMSRVANGKIVEHFEILPEGGNQPPNGNGAPPAGGPPPAN